MYLLKKREKKKRGGKHSNHQRRILNWDKPIWRKLVSNVRFHRLFFKFLSPSPKLLDYTGRIMLHSFWLFCQNTFKEKKDCRGEKQHKNPSFP